MSCPLGGIDPAGFFKPARMAAPVAAAVITVPLTHAFPFFAVGDDGLAGGDLLGLGGGRDAVNHRDHRRGAALGTKRHLSWFRILDDSEFLHFWQLAGWLRVRLSVISN